MVGGDSVGNIPERQIILLQNPDLMVSYSIALNKDTAIEK